MNKNKILYDSEPESEEEEPIEQPIKIETTQNEIKPIPKTRIRKKIAQPVKEWKEFVDDNIEKPQTEAKTPSLKPFKCEYCSKAFVHKFHCDRHIREQRCTIKRAVDVRRENELKEMEKEIMLKLQKKELAREKRAMKKQLPPEKPIKPVKKTVPRKPKPIQEPIEEIIHQPKPVRPNNNIPKYKLNF